MSCEPPKTLTTPLMRMLWRAQHGRCRYCKQLMVHIPGTVLDSSVTWDHVVPRSRGGSNAVENLVLACRSCNNLKGNKTLAEFLIASSR